MKPTAPAIVAVVTALPQSARGTRGGHLQDSGEKFDGVRGRQFGGLIGSELDHFEDAIDVRTHRRLTEQHHTEQISGAVAMMLSLEGSVSGEHEDGGDDGDDGRA